MPVTQQGKGAEEDQHSMPAATSPAQPVATLLQDEAPAQLKEAEGSAPSFQT